MGWNYWLDEPTTEFTDSELEEHDAEVRAKAIEKFERKMAHFCFGLKASQGNLARVDVFEEELARVKRQLKEPENEHTTI